MELTPEVLARWLSVEQAAALVCGLTFADADMAMPDMDGLPVLPGYPQLATVARALVDGVQRGELPADTAPDEQGYASDVADWRISRDALVEWILTHHPQLRPTGLVEPETPALEHEQELERARARLAQAQLRITALEAELAALRAAVTTPASATGSAKDGAVEKSALMRKVEVLADTRLPSSTLDQYIRNGTFPPRINPGQGARQALWRRVDVEAWIAGKWTGRRDSS